MSTRLPMERGTPLPQPAPALDERLRGTTVARENASAESEAEEPLGKRRQKRMRRGGAATWGAVRDCTQRKPLLTARCVQGIHSLSGEA